MAETVDRPNVVIPPPIAWALAILAGLGVGWLYPLQFVPTSIPRAWVGVGVFALGLALAIWAIVTIRRAGTQFDINKPTTAIVENGPYRFTRNPIYLGMFLGLIAIGIGSGAADIAQPTTNVRLSSDDGDLSPCSKTLGWPRGR